MRNAIGFLKIKETDFVGSTPHSKYQFLILGQFAEATKISILSNDQTCHLCIVGSIVFRCLALLKLQIWIWVVLLCVKFGKNLFSEDIWDIENFTFLIQFFEMVWATIHKLFRKSSAGCLPMIAHDAMVPNYFHFFSSLAPYFTCNDSDPVQIWSHVSRRLGAARLGIQDALSYPEWHGYFWIPFVGFWNVFVWIWGTYKWLLLT